jgi:hypothetical protein
MSGWSAESVVRLSDEILSPRRSGWRGVCEFEELPATGETRFGFEVLLKGRDWIRPGEESPAVLRFWAPVPDGLRLPAAARLCDGDRQVATATLLSLKIGSAEGA